MRIMRVWPVLLVGVMACDRHQRSEPTAPLPVAPQPLPPELKPPPAAGHPEGRVVRTVHFEERNLSGFGAVSNDGLAYITEHGSGKVHRVDLGSGKVTTFRPAPAYDNLRGIALTGDGDGIFVAAVDGHAASFDINDVLRFDADWRLVFTYRTGSIWGAPVPVVLSRDEGTVYTATATGVLHAVDAASGQRRLAVSAGRDNVSLALHPTRPAIYVSGMGHIDEVDTETGAVLRVDLGDDSPIVNTHTQSIGISPDGQELYVVHWRFDRGAVLVWNTAQRVVVDSIMLPEPARGLVVTPDGAHLYVASEKTTGEIWVFDRQRRTHVRTIPVGGAIGRLAISPDGLTVIAPNLGGWVDFIR